MKFIYKKIMIKNNKAFSLIELSIVLIIIGLLVAGITGGQSLIESANVQKSATEIKNWKQAINTFRVAKDRLPGDIDGSGYIGLYGQSYKAGDFGGDYSAITVNTLSGPFVDLYLEGIIDFKPEKTNGGVDLLKNLPNFISKKDRFYFETFRPGVAGSGEVNNSNSLRYKMDYGIYFVTITPSSSTDSKGGKSPVVDPEFMKKVDTKADDGIWNRGDIRLGCGKNDQLIIGVTPDSAILNSDYECYFIMIKTD